MNNQLYQYICTSLPYELKVYRDDPHPERGIYDLSKVSIEGMGSVYCCGNGYDDFHSHLLSIKPILRPLDLTKEITHKGETFIPDHKLQHLDSTKGYEGFPYDVLKGRYCDVQKLIEWHMDVGGWIESKEAIDVNTLKVNCYE